MPVNKNAFLRYQILDRCFSDFHHKYNIEDLLEKVNEALYDMFGTEVKERQIREDIKYMRDRVTYDAPIMAYQYDGKKCYYRYANRDFSIFNNELSEDEIKKLRSTIEMLGRYRGLPAYAWLEEVLSSLEYRFGVNGSHENVVSFEQNERLKGLEFLGELIDSTINHQPLRIIYHSFFNVEHDTIVHPYHIKQYNNRWFLFGLEETKDGNRPCNKALDRIVKFSKANVKYITNNDIDFDNYFNDVIGVTVPSEYPEPEEIVLKFDDARFPYVVSKPLHSSQIILSEEEHIVQINVRPNRELESLIFFFGPQVEVLKPQWLRKQITEKIQETLNNYLATQKGCTDK